MMVFLKQYKKMQVFNSYMTVKCLNEYLKSKFLYLNIVKLFFFKLNDHYDVIKASLIFMSCLKTVRK